MFKSSNHLHSTYGALFIITSSRTIYFSVDSSHCLHVQQKFSHILIEFFENFLHEIKNEKCWVYERNTALLTAPPMSCKKTIPNLVIVQACFEKIWQKPMTVFFITVGSFGIQHLIYLYSYSKQGTHLELLANSHYRHSPSRMKIQYVVFHLHTSWKQYRIDWRRHSSQSPLSTLKYHFRCTGIINTVTSLTRDQPAIPTPAIPTRTSYYIL
jgi:hypothetical protein